ncbi:MAG: tRNA (N(6)-L-threonylcarbamoyladenosine(37)-C(2))-methylthiotransferase MtaB [Pseudomonadota bacterium]
MNVHLNTLGCRLNEAELETWAEQFRARGATLVPTPDAADLTVLNTCAVTREAVRKSRQTLRRLHRANPEGKLVVTGCHATLSEASVAAELGVDLVLDNSAKDSLVDTALARLELPVMPEIATAPAEPSLFMRNRHRAFIKVQDGCRYRCTYCIVTTARGEERSRPIAEVVDEINRLAALGIQEAVLTGVHVGGYGSDLGCHLSDLVEAILADTALPRLRFASVEPWDLPEGFWRLFDNRRLMPHMHLPLQSGSDSVLRRMARRCKTAEFEALVADARSAVPGFNVTTDIIVGFPGETESEWQETLTTVERIGFGHMHIFSYSEREGTKAARLPDPVDNGVKAERSRALHALADQLKRGTLSSMVGTRQRVLWEGPGVRTDDGFTVQTGYTENFVRVARCSTVPTDPAAIDDVHIASVGRGPKGWVLSASV